MVYLALIRYLIKSLSARRAWIEIASRRRVSGRALVALRKESVDRNNSLESKQIDPSVVALRKESVDRNTSIDNLTQGVFSRSPQGERG